MLARCLSILATLAALWPRVSLAQLTPSFEMNSNAGQEYFVGREQGRPLVTVNLISGVKNPGVYHVPIETELPQLLAYAGGTVTRAETDEIAIRRVGKQGPEFSKVDLDDVIRHPVPLIRVQDKDTIVIPESTSTDNTVKWATVGASLATVVMTVFLISKAHSIY